MNPLLEGKINALETAHDYECWYLVKHSVAFDYLCYLVSFLQQYQNEGSSDNLEVYITHKIEQTNTSKHLNLSTNYRALRVASFFGLITQRNAGYADAIITETFNEITVICNGNYENTEIYNHIIQRQIEKMYISSSIDEEHERVRNNYRLYPVLLLYKILIELGKAYGEYKITTNEYRYLVATTEKYEKFLDTLLLINLLRKEPDVNVQLEIYRTKFDNRMIQAIKLLDTLEITNNDITIRADRIEDVAKKVFEFEKNTQLFETEDYLSFLGSTRSLFDLAAIEPPIVIDETNININPENELIRFKTGYQSPFDYNRIVFGAPGTGKSYNLNIDRTTLLQDTYGTYERVTFHPDYTYPHFVGAYKPITDDSGEIRYEFVPGPFMRVYVDALKSGRTGTPQPHLLLIEEINRAKVAAVFGDVFQLLDRDDDGVSEYEIHATEDIRIYLAKELGGSPNDYNRIRIPDNMFIWATMNSADQGVFPMDTAFKRRWHFEYLGINNNADLVRGKITLGAGMNALEVDCNQLRRAINEKLAKDFSVNEDKLLGPFFLSKKVLKTNGVDGEIINPEKFIDAFKSKVIMYLYEDAAKQNKHKLFDGCDSSKYSSVCEAFDEIGIGIFGNDFRELYNQQEV